jgi:ATP-dependent RNA helicase SUPV3L1/SUV3
MRRGDSPRAREGGREGAREGARKGGSEGGSEGGREKNERGEATRREDKPP